MDRGARDGQRVAVRQRAEVPFAGTIGTLTQRLAERLCEIRYEDLPVEVVRKAKEHLLYLIGSALGGRDTEIGARGREIARQLGGGAGRCTVIGAGQNASAVDAALANAAQIMGRGMDDYLLPAGGHPGVVTVPAALAVAEQERVGGKDLLLATVLGYELLGKLAELQWAWSASVPRRATIPFGPFGPAAASIRLLGLDPERAAHAIGYAANMAMGVAENPFGGLYYGFVARNGITAAVAARAGAKMPPTTLEGEHGFFMTFFGEIPEGTYGVTDRIGQEWEMLGAQLKRWATTGMNYPAIQLMLELVREHALDAESIARIVVHFSSDRENHATGHAVGPFTSRWDATSSGPFHLACAILDGRIDPARYERYDDPSVADLLQRIEVRLEETPTRDFAKLEVTTRDGRRLVAERERYETPPGTGLAWLREEGARAFPAERLERIARAVDGLEEMSDAGELTSLLCAEGTRS